MIRRIKPVSRVIKINAEVSGIRKEMPVWRENPLDWNERWVPRVDVYEKKNEIVVETEIPGVSPSDITISVQSSRVEIKGRKLEGPSPGKIKYLRLEREFGSFRRLVALPTTVVPDKTKAFLENGILTVSLKKYVPKQDKEKEIIIEISKNED